VTALSQTGQLPSQPLYLLPQHETFRPGESVLTPDSLPQVSRWGFAGRLTIAVLIVVAAVAVIALLIIQERDLARWRSFPTVQGQITTCETEYSNGRRGRSQEPSSQIRYRYFIGENAFDGSDSVPETTCEEFPIESPVTVYYNNGSPTASRLLRGESANREAYALAMGAFVVLGGFLFFDMINLLEFIGARRRTVTQFDSLTSAKTILDGTIYRAGRGGWFIDYMRTGRKEKPGQIYIAFRFESPTGKTLRGKQVFDWPINRDVPKRGTPVKILYASDEAYLLL
jgi:hypothetical protein